MPGPTTILMSFRPLSCPGRRAAPLLASALLAVALLTACGGPETAPPSTPSADTAASADGSSGPVAGGSEAPRSPLWTEIGLERGIDFVHRSGADGSLTFPEMMGGGIAVFDADEDGDPDLYFVSGETNKLYVQGDDGRFTGAGTASGLEDDGYGTGVAVGDVNNDGHEDVFVANIGADQLYLGRGDGRFEAATRKSGIEAEADPNQDWSTSAAFCDFSRDGWLDLYVVRYVVYDSAVRCTDKTGRPEYCGPANYEDRTDRLFMNQGDGTLRDVSAAAGIQTVTGAGLGVVCEDVDDDGWPDIYVANDGDPNQLWINQKDGTFIDDALIMGSSVNASGLYEAGMGVVAADFDNDADFDLFITHLRDETNTFYRNLGSGIGFEDHTAQVGLATESTPFTGFGTAPLDVDLDGDLDLVIANGRVTRGEPLTDALPGPWNPYGEPNLVYLNDRGRFTLAGDEAAAFTAPVEVGRGLAIGDLDGDGAVDLAVSNIESPARVYAGQASGHWLRIDTVDPRWKRRALGARVVLEAGGARQSRTVHGAMSYLSSSDPRAHFGLGTVDKVESVTVRWPDGLLERFAVPELDRDVVLRRGEGSAVEGAP